MRGLMLAAACGALMLANAVYAETPGESGAVVRGEATISGGFGPREQAFHPGSDVAAAPGTTVHAPADGQVVAVHAPGGVSGYHGQVLEIDHGDWGKTRFSNLAGVTLSVGDQVRAGDVLGHIAAREAPHVHVELWRDALPVDPALEMTLIAGR